MQRSRLVIVGKQAGLAQPDQEYVSNLPASLTPLIGREKQISQAKQLLQSDDVRMVTMTGPGGVGKTSLGVQVASDIELGFEDGAYFVPLASVDRPDMLVAAIIQALEVKDAGNNPPLETLKQHLRGKQLLLLLDNFEQVIDAGPIISELMSASPLLKVLVTSRVVLHIRGEHEFPVPPLPLPDKQNLQFTPLMLEDLSRNPAVALFAQRAAAVNPGFQIISTNAATVVDICARLDGLPLAIELAAARAKMLAPEAILARLDNRLRLLTGGARDLPARQQTLRNTLDWSYDLLDPGEQQLFRRLAIFAGGVTLEAAEAVCGMWNVEFGMRNTSDQSNIPHSEFHIPHSVDVLDGMASLADKSLVRREDSPQGEPRFFMLETIREYALERLEESGEAGEIARLHGAYYLPMVEAAEPLLSGPQQAEWFTRLEAEHDNLRAALRWSLQNDGAETALRMERVLWRFWEVRGHVSEGLQWIEEALAAGSSVPAGVRASALHGGSRLAWLKGDYDQTRRWAEESLTLWQGVDSKTGIAQASHTLAIVTGTLGDDVLAQAYYEQSLALWRELGNVANVARVLNSLGIVARTRGDIERAKSFFTEGLALSKELGNKRSISTLLASLGFVAHRQGDNEHARSLFAESLALRVELDHKVGMVECLVGMAGVAASMGQATTAAHLFGAVDALCKVTGYIIDPDDKIEYDHNLATAREQLDKAAFEAAWAKGQALTLEQAVQEALAPISVLRPPVLRPPVIPLQAPDLPDTHSGAETQEMRAEQKPAPEPVAIDLHSPDNLSRDELAAATNDLLRHFTRPYMLKENPLLRSRLVMGRAGEGAGSATRTAALLNVVKDALETMRSSYQDLKFYRAVYHTYIQPAATQEQASELLDIPFSTYRRHLKAGVSRLVDILWQWELEA